ncbi:MAG: hypothetical protein HQ498_01230 [Pseudohongiella sp.]|jgi:hypothetical protein|nr:hypothetical protein [Pseudohongiella sp.]
MLPHYLYRATTIAMTDEQPPPQDLGELLSILKKPYQDVCNVCKGAGKITANSTCPKCKGTGQRLLKLV